MKSMIKILCALAGALSIPAHADVAYRLAVIDEIQADAKIVGAPLMYVKQSGDWSVYGFDCPAEFAYFNAADNPHFVATLLAAGIADKVVRIYVDNTLTRVNTWCQIKYIALVPAS
jgi:hypothetical protein